MSSAATLTGIAHYIECREGYDRLLDLESFGGKVRDTDDEFKGRRVPR